MLTQSIGFPCSNQICIKQHLSCGLFASYRTRVGFIGTNYLKGLSTTICKEILKPFGKLETPVRKISMERQSDTKKPSNHIQSHCNPKGAPIERERSKNAQQMHSYHPPNCGHIQGIPLSAPIHIPLPLHHHIRQPNRTEC